MCVIARDSSLRGRAINRNKYDSFAAPSLVTEVVQKLLPAETERPTVEPDLTALASESCRSAAANTSSSSLTRTAIQLRCPAGVRLMPNTGGLTIDAGPPLSPTWLAPSIGGSTSVNREPPRRGQSKKDSAASTSGDRRTSTRFQTLRSETSPGRVTCTVCDVIELYARDACRR